MPCNCMESEQELLARPLEPPGVPGLSTPGVCGARSPSGARRTCSSKVAERSKAAERSEEEVQFHKVAERSKVAELIFGRAAGQLAAAG